MQIDLFLFLKYFTMNSGSKASSTFLEELETSLFLNSCFDFAVEVLQS